MLSDSRTPIKGEGQQKDILFKKSSLYRDDRIDKMHKIKHEAEVTTSMLAKHKLNPWHDKTKEEDGQFSKKNIIFLPASMQNCNYFPKEQTGEVLASWSLPEVCIHRLHTFQKAFYLYYIFKAMDFVLLGVLCVHTVGKKRQQQHHLAHRKSS